MATIEAVQVFQGFTQLLQELNQSVSPIIGVLTFIAFVYDLKLKKGELVKRKTKRILFFKNIFEMSRSVRNFYLSVHDEIRPKKVIIPIFIGLFFSIVVATIEMYYESSILNLYIFKLSKLIELSMILSIALTASLVITFILIIFFYLVIIEPMNFKKLKEPIYKNLVFYSFIFWGNLLYIAISLSILFNTNIIPDIYPTKLSAYSLIILFFLFFFTILDRIIGTRIKRGVQRLIELDKIDDFRGIFPKLKICTSCGVISGNLWDLTDQSIFLKSIGIVSVPWDEISWIEVIENEEQSNETPEEREPKKPSNDCGELREGE
uniref:Uncharacterized protein n=1 Tax=Pleomorphic virus ThalV2 TaxID=3115753 RepID=A0AAT9J7S0_9VIRU